MIKSKVKKQLNRSIFAIILLVFAYLCLLLVPNVLAHSPLKPDNNESLATATLIPDPTKSWAVYGELHEGGEAQYYRFNITEGQKIHIMLFKSTRSEEREFLPSFVLMGSGISEQGDVPDYVEKPLDARTFVANGEQPAQATFEPFSPSNFYSLADLALNAPATGTYYIAVFESTMGGHYGLAVGDRESYTLGEWILIPFNLLSIYQWEGQSVIFVFAPMILTLLIGVGLMIWRSKKKKTPRTLHGWIGSIAGLLFIGSGATILFQLTFSLTKAPLGSEVAITTVFALIPILLGIGTLRLSWTAERKTDLKSRIYLVVLGVAALFAWAGLIIGSALAIIASALPRRSGRS